MGIIEKLGSNVQGFKVGERCVVDPGVLVSAVSSAIFLVCRAARAIER